jgi:hypothetical protein
MFQVGRRDNILRCPFCERPLAPLEEIMTRFGNTVSAGRCACGTAFVYDGSGHNIGDAYVDCLTLATNGQVDNVWSLVPGEDYDILEMNYDQRRNRFSSEATGRGRRSPVYLFVKMKDRSEDVPSD